MIKGIITIIGKAILDILVIIKLEYYDRFIKNAKNVKVKVYKDYDLIIKPKGDIARILYSRQHLVRFKKGFEYTVLNRFLEHAKPNCIILDIGANIGLFSLLTSKYLNNQCIIHCFEPSKSTFGYLEENLRLNQIGNTVKLHNFGLSDQNINAHAMQPDGVAEIFSGGDAFNFFIPTQDESDIKLKKLDDFVIEHNIDKVDLIKVDIEGAELLCFKGGKNFLSSDHKPVIIFECAEESCSRFGYNKFDVLNYLNSLGYKIEEIEYNQYLAQ